MTPAPARIYLNPPRFWAATKDMTDEDAERFTNEIIRMAAEHRIEELGQYDFISFSHKRAA